MCCWFQGFQGMVYRMNHHDKEKGDFKCHVHWKICLFICQTLTGLFTADQKLAGQESIYTRQNPTGTRRGYECPEERDYYPYWHPTEWKDIAILTSDTSECEYYKKHSFNVEPKGKYWEYNYILWDFWWWKPCHSYKLIFLTYKSFYSYIV